MRSAAAPTYEQALASLSGPDGPFALVDAEVRGPPVRASRHAPATLRDFVVGARVRGAAELLVYEDAYRGRSATTELLGRLLA